MRRRLYPNQTLATTCGYITANISTRLGNLEFDFAGISWQGVSTHYAFGYTNEWVHWDRLDMQRLKMTKSFVDNSTTASQIGSNDLCLSILCRFLSWLKIRRCMQSTVWIMTIHFFVCAIVWIKKARLWYRYRRRNNFCALKDHIFPRSCKFGHVFKPFSGGQSQRCFP